MTERRALIVALVVSTLSLVSVRHFWPGLMTANEAIRLFFTESLVEDHTITLDAAMERHHSHDVDRAEREGHIYLDKAPGTSILALPAYLAHRAIHGPPRAPLDGLFFVLTLFACTLPSVVAAALLAREARQPLLVPALLCATPLALYATQFFGHAPAAAALALAYVACERRAFVACGFGCAAAVACEYPVAPLAACVGLFALHRGRREALWKLSLGAAPIVVALGAYHQAAFGSPFRTGYAFKADPTLARTHAQGFMGLTYPHLDWLWNITFSRERGLFFYAPWLLGAVPGCIALGKTDRSKAILLGVLCAGSLLLIASYDYWSGGDCVGPRLLVPALPFFALAAFEAPPRFRVVLAGLAAGALVSTWIAFSTFPFHGEHVVDPLFTISLPLLLGGYVAPPTIPYLWLLAPFLVVAAVAWITRPRWQDATLAGAIGVGYVLVMIATSPGTSPEAVQFRRLATTAMTPRFDAPAPSR